MANQLLREALWTSQRLKCCTVEVHLAYPYLLPIGDHWGRFEYDVRAIWVKVAAYRGDIPEEQVRNWLDSLERAGLFKKYGDGGKFAAWLNFKGMPQSRRSPSRYPNPPFDNSTVPEDVPAPVPPDVPAQGPPQGDICLGVVDEYVHEDEDEDEHTSSRSAAPMCDTPILSVQETDAPTKAIERAKRIPGLVAQAIDIWDTRWGAGSAPAGAIAREITALGKKHPAEQVLEALKRYVLESTHPSPNPSHFRQHFGDWLPGGQGAWKPASNKPSLVTEGIASDRMFLEHVRRQDAARSLPSRDGAAQRRLPEPKP